MDYQLILSTYHLTEVLGSIVVSIPACHVGDRGSIPRRGEIFLQENRKIPVFI